MARPKRATKATACEPAGAARLSPRQAAFVREYIAAGCANAKQAAIRAGYAGGASAEVTASRLRKNAKIAAEIEKAQGRLLRRHELSADRLLRATTNIAFFDPGELFDKNWNILPWSRIPPRARQAISRLEFRDGMLSRLSFRDRMDALRILIDLVGPLKLPPDAPSAPPAESEKLPLEQFRAAAAESEGQLPPLEDG